MDTFFFEVSEPSVVLQHCLHVLRREKGLQAVVEDGRLFREELRQLRQKKKEKLIAQNTKREHSETFQSSYVLFLNSYDVDSLQAEGAERVKEGIWQRCTCAHLVLL